MNSKLGIKIGIDLDNPNDLELVMVSHNAEAIADEVKYFISTGKRGVHLEIFFSSPLFEYDSKSTLRLTLRDDIRRVVYDTERILNGLAFMYDTLWSEKRVKGKILKRIECPDLENCLSMLRMYRRQKNESNNK